jgi:transcriptional regulator with XRE-family HTH domain
MRNEKCYMCVSYVMADEQMTLAEWVTSEAEARHWSLRTVARLSVTEKRPHGYTVTTIAEIAKGARTSIDYDVARGLANAFGVDYRAVLARAGIVPASGEILPEVEEINAALLRLSPAERPQVIAMIGSILRLAGVYPPQSSEPTQ